MEPHNALAYGREPLPAALRLASDAHLAEQVRAGSERAFEALFERYHTALLHFCARMLGSLPEAEDAVQLTFMAAYRDLVQAKRPAVLRAWLYAIARHRCLNALRARREQPLAHIPEVAVDHLATEVATRDDLRGMLADLATLPREQRQALVLAELGDISHNEIAKLLGCPRQKVKSLVFQARSSLAAARNARETPCVEIRQQLASLRGGSLRRALLRRHLSQCPGCRAFRDELRSERGVLLPVALGLKRTVLGALFGSGGEAGGALISTGTVVVGRLAATALAAIILPAGGIVILSEAQGPETLPTRGAPFIAAPAGRTASLNELGALRPGAWLPQPHAPTAGILGLDDHRPSPPAGTNPEQAAPTTTGEAEETALATEVAEAPIASDQTVATESVQAPIASGQTVANKSAQAPNQPARLAPPTAPPPAKAAPTAIAPRPLPTTVLPVAVTGPSPAPQRPSDAPRPSGAQQLGPAPPAGGPERPAAADELGPPARSSSQAPTNPRSTQRTENAAAARVDTDPAPPTNPRATQRTAEPAAARVNADPAPPTNPRPSHRTEDAATARVDTDPAPPTTRRPTHRAEDAPAARVDTDPAPAAEPGPTQRADRRPQQSVEADQPGAARASVRAERSADTPTRTADARRRDAAAADARPVHAVRTDAPSDDAPAPAQARAVDPKNPTDVATPAGRDGNGERTATADRDAQPVADHAAPAPAPKDHSSDRTTTRDNNTTAEPTPAPAPKDHGSDRTTTRDNNTTAEPAPAPVPKDHGSDRAAVHDDGSAAPEPRPAETQQPTSTAQADHGKPSR